MSATAEDAERANIYGASIGSAPAGLSGVIAYTITTDGGKATALGKLAKGDALTVHARLSTVTVPAHRKQAFVFKVSASVIGRVKAWREEHGPRLDYFVWISHAGPGFLSAFEGQANGPIEISRMDLVLPPEGNTGEEKTKRKLAEKKCDEARAKLGAKGQGDKLRTIGEGTPHGQALRSYIRLDSVAELIAACRPRVIHMVACSFGKEGDREVAGLRSVHGPVALATLVAQRLCDYSCVMTYSSVDTGLSADNPHIQPGNPGVDNKRLLIRNGLIREGSPQEAEQYLNALREEEAMHAEEVQKLVPIIGQEAASLVQGFLGI